MSLTKTHIDTLVTLCREENQLAQLEVYNRYNRAMYNTAVRIVKDTAIAEDVMQVSFIAAFDKIDSFKETATFGAWLKRIVVNNSIAEYKKNKKFVSLDGTEDYHLEEEEVPTYDETNFSNVQSQQLYTAMDELNESYRRILTLHYIEGYDYDELSQILDKSYGSCRTLVSRAKESLRMKLNTVTN